jgi:hypothetical protein
MADKHQCNDAERLSQKQFVLLVALPRLSIPANTDN